MDDAVTRAVAEWDDAGFAVLPGFLPARELGAALRGLGRLVAAAGGARDAVPFPFADVDLSLLAVHPQLVGLAAALLRTDDLRLVRAEVRATTAGAASDGDGRPPPPGHERDTPLVPSDDPRFRQLVVVVHLSDVTAADGPAVFLPGTTGRAAAGAPEGPLGPGPAGAPATAAPAAPTAATGPVGTVVVHEIGTAPVDTPIAAPGGARHTLHVGLRPAAADWGVGQGWAGVSQQPDWSAFVHRATHRQLALVGFPPPGHPYWTHRTLRAMAERYPCLDLTRWAHRVSEPHPPWRPTT